MKISAYWLQGKGACKNGIDWFLAQKQTDGVSVLKALIKAEKLDWANWLICRLMDKPQRVRYAIFAAEQVISIFEKKYPKDSRLRKAIEAAKAWVENPNEETKSAAVLAAAAYAAYAAAADAAAFAAAFATSAAAAAANAADAAAAAAAAAYAAYDADAAADAYAAAAYAAAAYADARKKIQLKILKYGMGILAEKP